jgi:hypothetical protein
LERYAIFVFENSGFARDSIRDGDKPNPSLHRVRVR